MNNVGKDTNSHILVTVESTKAPAQQRRHRLERMVGQYLHLATESIKYHLTGSPDKVLYCCDQTLQPTSSIEGLSTLQF